MKKNCACQRPEARMVMPLGSDFGFLVLLVVVSLELLGFWRLRVVGIGPVARAAETRESMGGSESAGEGEKGTTAALGDRPTHYSQQQCQRRTQQCC